MQRIMHGKSYRMHRIKRLFFILLFIFPCSVCLSQSISLALKNASLEKAFREIEGKVPQRFVYTREMMEQSSSVSVTVFNEPLQKVLELIFEEQPLQFSLDENFIKVRFKPATTTTTAGEQTVNIEGTITDENGTGLNGITITAKQTGATTATDNSGNFILQKVKPSDVLLITGIGYIEKQIALNGKTKIITQLQLNYTGLDETIVMAYGTTTKRLNTGNITKISHEEISKQPVANPLAILQGRVPGLTITQTTGYAGGAIDILLRGQNSLLQGSQPLFVVDGIPLSTQNTPINQVTNAVSAFGASVSGGISPFYLVNPNDIESIEILKDADATSIYGSRGANGVILITTKKGNAGKTKLSANLYSGWSRVTRTMDMLTTSEYVSMRKEAFANDGIAITGVNATDLLAWDTTRYTDFKKLLLGGTAHTYDANVSISGGSGFTDFLVSGGYHRETTVLPSSYVDYRASAHTAFNHASSNKKFSLSFSGSFSFTKNNLPAIDIASAISRPPNMRLYDSAGKLSWQEGGVTLRSLSLGNYANPLAAFETKYTGKFQNLTSTLLLSYKPLPSLTIKSNLGYNTTIADEVRTNPSTSLDPFDNAAQPNSNFANSNNNTWIVEPQLEYVNQFRFGKITFLGGTTFQKKEAASTFISALNYTSDLLLNSVSGAGTITTSNDYNEYRYNAVFGRLNYNWKNKYIVNLSARRDGSSRFGQGKQFSNFGAIGGAWIFTNEKFIDDGVPWLNFGKLRASYGTAGNDLIGDYQFFDTWSSSSANYQGVQVLLPRALYNPDLAWEINKKWEAAIDIEFLNGRIQFSAAHYRNRAGNQLISYSLPFQTGFNTIKKNLAALIQNKGYEFILQTHNIRNSKFSWMTQFNLSAQRNKLLEFPSLETSSYASQFVVGEPISVVKVYHFTGVDPATGLYTFQDADRNGSLNTTDRTILKNTQPKFYGGFQNILNYKGIELSLFFQFVKQTGLNYLYTISTFTPGYKFRNQPDIVLNRWRQPGDASLIQKFTTQQSGSLNQSENLVSSDAVYSDASFVRLKNASLSYTLPSGLIKRIRAESVKLYVHGQNLLTITDYLGADPENQSIYRMPPMGTIVIGAQLNF